jgi:hypothetical protein
MFFFVARLKLKTVRNDLLEFFHVFFFSFTLKQQSADRHVALLGHIILIPSQPVFSLSLVLRA